MRFTASRSSCRQPLPQAGLHRRARLSPWSHTIGPQARRACELALAIRLPYRHATKALETPPLEIEYAIAEAVTAARVGFPWATMFCSAC